MDVDPDVAGDADALVAVDKDRLAEHMTARTLPHLEAERREVERGGSALRRHAPGEGLLRDVRAPPQRHEAVETGRLISRQDVAEAGVGHVSRYLHAPVRLALKLQEEVLEHAVDHVDTRREVAASRMVDVAVSEKELAAPLVPVGVGSPEHGEKLVVVAGEAGVDEEQAVIALEHPGVAPGGRLDEQTLGAPRRREARHPDACGVARAPVRLDVPSEPLDVGEGPEGVVVGVLEVLHDAVGVDQDLLLLVRREPHELRDAAREGEVEEAGVDDVLVPVVVEDLGGADATHVGEKVGELVDAMGVDPEAHDLLARARHLDVEVRDVEVMAVGERERRVEDPRRVIDAKLDEIDPADVLLLGEDAQLAQTVLGGGQLLRRPLYLDEEGVDVDDLVVARPHDVETFAREDAVCLEERALVVAEHEHERPSHANTPSDDHTVTPGTSYCCCERSESTNCRAPRAERPPRRVAKRSARRSSSSWSIRMSASSASLWTMSR